NGLAHRGRHAVWIAGGLDHHRHAVLRALLIGPIDLRPWIVLETLVTDVTHHANHLHPWTGRDLRDAEPLPHRILPAEDLARDALVQNSHRRPAIQVAVTECPSGKKRDPQSAKIIAAGEARIDIDTGA